MTQESEYFVSIVIPVYNVEKYIGECVTSVMNQNIEQKTECLLVDDCGKDNSIAVAQELIDKYEGDVSFKIVRYEHNKGCSGARNEGARRAKGEYLLFMDSDDYLLPNGLKTLVDIALQHKGVDIVHGTIKAEDKEANPFVEWPDKLYRVPEYSDNETECQKRMQERHYIGFVNNRMVRREFFETNKLYFFEGIIHEDDIWNFCLGRYVKSIAHTPKETYFYRANPNGIMGTLNIKSFNSRCQIADYVLGSIRLGSSYDRELTFVLSEMHKAEDQFKLNPFDKMQKGNSVLKKLYTISFYDGDKYSGVVYKIMRIALRQIFRLQCLVKK